jgi:hypothetical protein
MTVDGFREMVWVEHFHTVAGALRKFLAWSGVDGKFRPGRGADR